MDSGCRLLADHFWQQNWPGEFFTAPYEAKIISQSPDAVTLELSRVSQGIATNITQSGLRVSRRVTLTADSPLLYVEASLQNVGKVGRLAGYWAQNVLYPNGDKDETLLFYRPAVRGASEGNYSGKTTLLTVNPDTNIDGSVREPQNGWMA